MPAEILVDWVTDNGGGKVSVFYADSNQPIGAQRTALATFLSSLDGFLDTGTSWVMREVGRIQNDATGALTGQWSDPVSKTGAGGTSGEAVPDAAQVLLRWQTATIIDGRFLQGRTFIPGMGQGNIVLGNLGSGAVSTIQGFQATLVAANTGLGVWHRPVVGPGGPPGSGGSFHEFTSGTVWPEIAVLRRRRG